MFDVPDSTLVLTKLRLPAIRPRAISRLRLLERPVGEPAAGLVLVCAPAGYGKTTLLAEWAHGLQAEGRAVAWISLDESDNAPATFGVYLVGSLALALGEIAETDRLSRLLLTSPEIDLQAILPPLINAVASSGRACWLIMDDYHLIHSSAIHAALAYLVEHSPENLHVAVGSRADPPLPIARLRARGLLHEVRLSALRFTSDETRQFLNQVMQLELPPALIADLEQRTEGWAAGLQLAAIILQPVAGNPPAPVEAVGTALVGPPAHQRDLVGAEQMLASFTGGHRFLVQYLLDEVLNRQPEQVRSFLLSTSILERMSADLCDAVIGGEAGSEQILQYLDRSNLFLVALDAQGDWYRYHHLFRDFLHARLVKTHPQGIASLHRVACEWYAAAGSLREAAQHAFRTRDWDYAAAFVEEHGFSLIVHSELATIYECCAAFPEEVIQAHPFLCILQCWPWVFRFEDKNRQRIEVRLRQAERVIATLSDLEQAHGLSEHIQVIRTFLAIAPDPAPRPQDQLAQAQALLAAYPPGDPGQFSGLLISGYAHMALHDAPSAEKALEDARQSARAGNLYFGMVESTFHLTRLAYHCGRFRRADEICQETHSEIALLLAHPEQELPAIGCLDIALGCVLIEQDQLEQAEQRLLSALERIGWSMIPYYPMTACVALFRLRLAQGRLAEALDFLARLETAWPDIEFCTQGLRVLQNLHAAPDDSTARMEAAAWARTNPPPVGDDVLPPGMGPFGAADVYYLAYLTWAQIQVALGEPRAALPYLKRQLELAERYGLETRLNELLLVEAQARQAAGGSPPETLRQKSMSSDTDHQVGDLLSERELELLSLVAQGASNQVIADQLVITVGTVKSHINHILRKLEARNRTEAVARARQLGLFDG